MRIVGSGEKVAFVPVHVVEDEQGTMWVAGVQDGARVIVQGQDFVREGQVVAAVPAEQESGQPVSGRRPTSPCYGYRIDETTALSALPPSERGRSTREAGRVGVTPQTRIAVRRDPHPAPEPVIGPAKAGPVGRHPPPCRGRTETGRPQSEARAQ